MCSILSVLAIYIISFCLACDYISFFPLVLSESLSRNGNQHKEKSGQEEKVFCPAQLVPPSQRDLSFAHLEISRSTQGFEKPSLARSNGAGEDPIADGLLNPSTVEVSLLQAHLQWKTRTLCQMWPILEGDNGCQFCSSGSSNHPKNSAMEQRPMGRAIPLGTGAVDQISQKKAISKAEIQKRETRTTCKRKRQAEASRRPGAVWSTIAACYALLGTTLDDSLNSSAQHVNRPFLLSADGDQGRQRQGQAAAFTGCRSQEAPRRPARRCSGLDEGCLHPCWSAGNQTAPCGGVTTRQSKAGDRRCTGRQAEHACGLEELPVTISSTMDCIHKPVHVPGETAHGPLDRLQAAQENLAVAKENLSSSQLAAGVVPKEDAAMASDTEDIPAKAHDSAAGEKIAASFQDLANNLRALHTQAVQAVQQEVDQQDRKRPRTESPNSKEKEKETPPNPGFGEGE